MRIPRVKPVVMLPVPAPVPRVVIDTNILVAAAYKPGSASGRVVAACLEGRLLAVISPAILQEYRAILPRAVRGPSRSWEDWFPRFLGAAMMVEPLATPAVVSADPTDDALFAAALAGGASAIVTNDRPVLQIKIHQSIHVQRPPACLEELLGEPPL